MHRQKVWCVVEVVVSFLVVARSEATDGTCTATDPTKCTPKPPEPDWLCTAHASDSAFARLCAWLATECNGAAEGTENVYLGTFDHGGVPVRGIGAAKDFAKNEVVFCVPKRCWMTRGYENVQVKQMAMGIAACGGVEKLVLQLAEEKRKGNASFFAPYIAWLPTRQELSEFHPAYLTGVEMPAHLSYWKPWSEGLRTCHKDYSAVARESGWEAPSWEDAYEALVLVISRTFAETDLVPLADTVNTEPLVQHNVRQTWKSNAQDSMCLNTLRSVSIGEELLLDYGAESHSAMLMFAMYGFALPTGHHDPTGHGLGEGVNVGDFDVCQLLESLQLPDQASSDAVVQKYRDFAAQHCSDQKSILRRKNYPKY